MTSCSLPRGPCLRDTASVILSGTGALLLFVVAPTLVLGDKELGDQFSG